MDPALRHTKLDTGDATVVAVVRLSFTTYRGFERLIEMFQQLGKKWRYLSLCGRVEKPVEWQVPDAQAFWPVRGSDSE
jgi:hypothetical protein